MYAADVGGSGRRVEAGSQGTEAPGRSFPAQVLSRIGNGTRGPSEDSWVEISSRPSSSSLSSADHDEIVTTRLRVSRARHSRPHRRQRRGPLNRSSLRPQPAESRSSQDEYEETESEEDRVMTSSNENLPCSPAPRPGDALSPPVRSTCSVGSPIEHAVAEDEAAEDDNFDDGDDDEDDDDDDDDDDENSTALGVVVPRTAFTPQPNVFSHPPSSQAGPRSGSAPYLPSRERRPSRAAAASAPRRTQHSPYSIMSPSHQADHDAALRASLSTLLSCAAAARGLPKPSRASSRAAAPNTIQPSTLQIVSESVVMGGNSVDDNDNASKSDPAEGGRQIGERPDRPALSRPKSKRKAPASPVKGGKERVLKKPKTIFDDSVTTSLLTWVVSAGVVVLVGAISFSAGYAMGREVGKVEASMIDVSDGRACGRDAVRGLKRFRWTNASSGTAMAR